MQIYRRFEPEISYNPLEVWENHNNPRLFVRVTQDAVEFSDKPLLLSNGDVKTYYDPSKIKVL